MDPEHRVQTLRDKLASDERGGCPRDRDSLREFEDTLALLSSEYSAYRREKLLRHCTRISEHADIDITAVLDDEAAAKTAVRWINRQYDNPETNRDYRVALRAFGKHLTDGDDVPDSVSWIPASTPSNYQPTPDPAEMLRWEDDVKPMIDAAANDRDAALIAVAFDTGCRSGELRELTVGDVSDGDYGLRLRVDGKTGARTVALVPSEHYLSQWLGSHPGSTDSEAPLWSKLGTVDSLSYRRFRDIFEEVADRAEIAALLRGPEQSSLSPSGVPPVYAISENNGTA
jgi:integrase